MAIPNRLSRVIGMGVVVVLAIAGTACGSITDSADEVRQVGVIVGYNTDDPQIVIPDTVQAGVEFVVEVTTYGEGFSRKGETELKASPGTVTISPYDYAEVGGGGFSILFTFVHRATIQFSEPGLASVVIRGRASERMEHEAVEVIREVVVEHQASN